MAAVSVFVDEAVRGTLPMVCAKTGEPADYMIRTTRPVGGAMPATWLLVLLGPPGWLLLVVLSVLSPGEQLTVRIPRSRSSFERERQLTRSTWVAALLGLSCIGLALPFAGQQPLLWLALGGMFLVAAAVLHALVCFDGVGVSLDGSRRWVTLTGVHPAFVQAVDLQEAGIHRS